MEVITQEKIIGLRLIPLIHRFGSRFQFLPEGRTLMAARETRRGLSSPSITTHMSPAVSVFLGVQLKIRGGASENEGVWLKNQEMFLAILPHCGSRCELLSLGDG
jgi:hypothetical protein